MKKILCIGGSGVLGKNVVSALSKHTITNVDFNANTQAANNILLDKSKSAHQNNISVADQIKSLKPSFDSIIVTAGGWTGGSIENPQYIQQYKKMMDMNLYPSLLAAHLAANYLAKDRPSSVIFTGAAAVFREPQPSMIAYSLSKTAVHSLAMNLAANFENTQANVLTILPEVIDTPSNRQGMPKADFSKWASPSKIGQMIQGWVEGLNVPPNGSFLLLKVKDGGVLYDFV